MPSQQSRKSNVSAVRDMIRTLESCAAAPPNDAAPALLGMAARALAQLQSHGQRVTVEAAAWRDKYERLARRHDHMAEEKGRLRVRCRQLEGDERRRRAVLRERVRGLTHELERLERDLVPLETSSTTPPSEDTATTFSSSVTLDSFESSLSTGSDDFQIDPCEDSLDHEVEEFSLDPCGDFCSTQLVEFQPLRLSDGSDVTRVAAGEDEETGRATGEEGGSETRIVTSSRGNATVRERATPSYMRSTESSAAKRTPKRDGSQDATPCDKSVANTTLETHKEASRAPGMHPLQLLQRMFVTQTRRAYDTVPALTASDSLESLSIDYSICTRSSSDLLGATPEKKRRQMSPQPNAQWAIIE